jgi:hypothetical protein
MVSFLVVAAIAAVALVAYAGIMGYLDFPVHVTGKCIQIQNFTRDDSGMVTVYVQNVDDSNVTLSEVYINGILDSNAIGGGITLSPAETVKINLTFPNTDNQLKVRVVTDERSFMELTKTYYGIRVEDYQWDNSTGKIKVYVHNTSVEEVVLNEVYVNGTLDESAVISPKELPVFQRAVGQNSKVTLSEVYVDEPAMISIRVVTDRGYWNELTAHGLPVSINKAYWNSTNGQITIHLLYFSQEEATLSKVFVNGTLDDSAVFSRRVLQEPFQISEITLSGTYVNRPTQTSIQVVAEDGKFQTLYDLTEIMEATR